ncbi:MAG TPA: hypothetical protein VFE05_05985 [Longimicrobiaceae bacterium]|nr:hypothetical protein [Longimicrobiaceae bacterium]
MTDRPLPSAPAAWQAPRALFAIREPYPGFHIIREIPGDLGLLLWRGFTEVALWAEAGDKRGDLFTARAYARRLSHLDTLGVLPALDAHLRTLAEILSHATEVAPERVTAACLALSEWASRQGCGHSAMALAQSAALASPMDANAAYMAGLAARKQAEYAVAESWFRRAVSVANRTRNWKAYALTFCGIGNMHIQRGAWPAAKEALLRALRTTRRHRLVGVRGRALHDLFCVAINAGCFDEANRLARAALRAYGRHDPRLPALAHDVACAWMRQGHVGKAVPVLEALVRYTSDAPLRLLFVSSQGRAAGLRGERMAFASAWTDAWAMVHASESTERVPEALVNLARGAAALNDPERASYAAHYARTVAVQRAEAQSQFEAEWVLEAVARADLAAVAADDARDEAGAPPEPGARLVGKFVAVLATSGRH